MEINKPSFDPCCGCPHRKPEPTPEPTPDNNRSGSWLVLIALLLIMFAGGGYTQSSAQKTRYTVPAPVTGGK